MAKTNADLIWSIANLLRGPYQPNQYGDVILPFTILRRLDCILEPTKDQVLAEYKKLQGLKVDPGVVLKTKFKLPFYNTSRWTFASLVSDPEGVADNLIDYIERFSPNVRDVFEGFRMPDLIADLQKSDRLYLIVKEFAAVDLHPKVVSGHDMGYIFEELIRKFAESNNAQAGDHFTPREVIALMVDILFDTADDALTKPGTVRTIYDPAAGTGGMLSTAYDHLIEMNHSARPVLYGQEINPRSYAMCKSDMIIKGQDVDNIYLGDTLTDDGHSGRHFDFLLSNPPFGVEWKTQQKVVTDEYEQRGFAGRFGPGLPRVSDGSLLFLLHLISKMQPVRGGEGGSRLAIVLNGSPLFTGGAGSGESNIRQWIIENDLLDAIIALPTDMFYNTGISTYIWILDNNKPEPRRGKVQLINGVNMFGKMRKSLGSKRKYLRPEDIERLCRLYDRYRNEKGTDTHPAHSKVLRGEEFGYATVTVERPLQLRFEPTEDKIDEVLAQKSIAKLKDGEQAVIRKALKTLVGWTWTNRDAFVDELKAALRDAGITRPGAPLVKTIWSTIGEHDPEADIVTNSKGDPEPDPALRDTENVPLTEDIEEYFAREVLPHVPDAWIDHDKTKIGYEIPFTRHFYRYVPPRPLDEIQKDLRALVSEIQAMLSEVGA
ncbi:type I restriction-modification system, DNA-methyltransferase subunit M [Rhodococcus aetherivorans]|uniref:site-specific DNA-methyltransferase (adenine-specific) n=1 Tax=Rhodococcus aetherivorans TaxID=191292 RepID=A0ABQ0YN26_9NOCA|nr:class I SAM-dependent DNA methyltransferase [Rhodococcus aetherivorans]ETT28766.1 N-6 DNA methylase [Rhodococcus rhodochrous ATCC 21198]NGP26397.1 SAM-dependent DNA methyltransferase [Rhodococcus aetherivorans]GES37943.1 type I restriction-modification system, DNA-methyltransferase subunit M [Rhodococcus aetherivorans]